MKRPSRILAAALAAIAIPAIALAAETTVIVVRHAEQLRDGSRDPALAPGGEARAARLAEMLASAGLKAIYTSERLRAKETAAPLAKQLGISPVVMSADDTKALVARIRKQHLAETVLVVGHSNTVPEILKLLGMPGPLITIEDTDFGNVFVVVRPKRGAPTITRLHY